MSGKKKNLSGKKPSNGANLSDRRSNLRSKGKAWKEQLVQGVKEKEIADALKVKLDSQRKLMQDEKVRLRNEAKQLDIELGFVDPNLVKPNKIPAWKKQKMFLNEIFPPPIICRKYNGVMVFRNKLSMQEYQHRVITPEEWEANAVLLDEMRALYDEERAAERGESTEVAENDNCNDDEEDEGESQDDREEEEGSEEGEGCEDEADCEEEGEEGQKGGKTGDGAYQVEGHSQEQLTEIKGAKVDSAVCSKHIPDEVAVSTDGGENEEEEESESLYGDEECDGAGEASESDEPMDHTDVGNLSIA